MSTWATVVALLVIAGPAVADVPGQREHVLVQFSVGTGTTVVGFRVLRQPEPGILGQAQAPGRLCLRLPFGCAMVLESAASNGSGVVVRPQVGPIAFEIAVGSARAG